MPEVGSLRRARDREARAVSARGSAEPNATNWVVLATSDYISMRWIIRRHGAGLTCGGGLKGRPLIRDDSPEMLRSARRILRLFVLWHACLRTVRSASGAPHGRQQFTAVHVRPGT